MEVTVIGSGVGGLAAGLRMLRRGHDCTIYERQDQIGGRARVFERGEYVFDAGPTIITAPFLFEELFELFGEDLHDHVKLVRMDPWYRIRYGDGDTLDFSDSVEGMVDEIRSLSPQDARRYPVYLRKTRRLFEIAFGELRDQPFNDLFSMMKVLPDLLQNDALATVYGKIDQFFRNDKIKKALSFHPLLIGGNPLTTTSIYRLIHYLEREWGVHYVKGGTNQLIDALGTLFRDQGGTIRLNSTVERIRTQNETVHELILKDETRISTDVVVSNVDPPYLYENIIDDDERGYWTQDRLDELDYSMGLFVLFFGTDRTYDHLEHHEILLTEDYEDVLTDIFSRKNLPRNLNLYLHRPTATDPSLAPEGHETMYALVPVPNLRGDQDWSEIGDRFADRVLQQLEVRVCPELTESLTERFFMTPEDFRTDYLSRFGSGFSIQPTLSQSAWFRFNNKSHIEDLYLVGAGTHPGAGLPGVVSSAKTMENSLRDGL
jgi:phytoene desaturase